MEEQQQTLETALLETVSDSNKLVLNGNDVVF